MKYSLSRNLLCSFLVVLIAHNKHFVRSFLVQISRCRLAQPQALQYGAFRRSQQVQLQSDSDDYNSGEDDSKIFRDDLDDDILEDEGAEDEDVDDDEDETDEDETGVDSEGIPFTWQERRQSMNAERDRKAAAIRAKLSWEEKFEDDPLRADSPTKPLEPEVEPYEKIFVAIGEVAGSEMLSKRSRAWVHHMQWARRTALLPNVAAKVKWEYTRLSPDCMGPVGQVVGIKANSSSEVRHLLETEPLQVTGGVSKWKLFEFNQVQHENVTWDLHDPRLFLGFDVEGSSKSNSQYESLLTEHSDYHIGGGRISTLDPVKSALKGEPVMIQHPSLNYKRAVMMGRLIACEGEEKMTNGNLILFNAKTNADATRYMSLDPLMKAKNLYDKKNMIISPVNEQDVDGLHHMMARTFGEKTVLDQVNLSKILKCPQRLINLIRPILSDDVIGLYESATSSATPLMISNTLISNVGYRCISWILKTCWTKWWKNFPVLRDMRMRTWRCSRR